MDEMEFGMSISHGNKQCKKGIRLNQKPFILMNLGNMWIVVSIALKSRMVT
jgi:hypothetical protein